MRFLSALVIVLVISTSNFAAEVCFCGSLDESKTEFRVEGMKCCTGEVVSYAIARTTYYVENGDGTYSITERVSEKPSAAQNKCCDPT